MPAKRVMMPIMMSTMVMLMQVVNVPNRPV